MKVEEFPLTFVAPAAFGVLVGAILLTNKFHDHPKGKIINAGLFLSGIAMFTMPFGSRIASRDIIQTINTFLPHTLSITVIHLLVVLAFLMGLANAFVFVPANTILQEKTSDEVRGKIYGVLNTAIGLFSLLPIIIVGSLSDILGVGRVIIGIGITLLLLGCARIIYRI
jgi:MFS family permease